MVLDNISFFMQGEFYLLRHKDSEHYFSLLYHRISDLHPNSETQSWRCCLFNPFKFLLEAKLSCERMQQSLFLPLLRIYWADNSTNIWFFYQWFLINLIFFLFWRKTPVTISCRSITTRPYCNSSCFKTQDQFHQYIAFEDRRSGQSLRDNFILYNR